jgi:hypothetical protein
LRKSDAKPRKSDEKLRKSNAKSRKSHAKPRRISGFVKFEQSKGHRVLLGFAWCCVAFVQLAQSKGGSGAGL